MATSSFDKHFVINDPKAVEQLIHAMENPTEIKLPQKDLIKEQQDKQDFLCAIKKTLSLSELIMNS